MAEVFENGIAEISPAAREAPAVPRMERLQPRCAAPADPPSPPGQGDTGGAAAPVWW